MGQATRYTKETEQKCGFGQNGRKLKHRKSHNGSWKKQIRGHC